MGSEGLQLRNLLPREHVVVPLPAQSVSEALDVLADRLVRAGAVRDPAMLERLVAEQAARDIIAIGDEVVLPHFRTTAVDRLAVALGIAREPLQGTAADRKPRIVVLVLAPPGAATLYLQTVSALARLLRRPEFVEQLLDVSGSDEVRDLPGVRDLRIQPELTVRDIMSHRVRSVAPDRPLREALDLMLGQGVRAVPVVGDKGEVLGIVTESDIMRTLLPQVPRAGAGEGADAAAGPQQVTVRDVMGRSVLCISEDLGLNEAANMMINKDVEQLPVVREGRLSGFITRGDIIRKLFGH